MLSRPGWLTYSGRFTHISGHPSATGRAQDRESSPVRDRRSATVPRNQPVTCLSVCLSVTFVNSVIANKHIFKFCSPSRSQTILVFPYQTSCQYSDGDPLMWVLNAGGVGRRIAGYRSLSAAVCDQQVRPSAMQFIAQTAMQVNLFLSQPAAWTITTKRTEFICTQR